MATCSECECLIAEPSGACGCGPNVRASGNAEAAEELSGPPTEFALRVRALVEVHVQRYGTKPEWLLINPLTRREHCPGHSFLSQAAGGVILEVKPDIYMADGDVQVCSPPKLANETVRVEGEGDYIVRQVFRHDAPTGERTVATIEKPAWGHPADEALTELQSEINAELAKIADAHKTIGAAWMSDDEREEYGERRSMMLADECQTLRDENTALLAENARLRRALERKR